MYQEKLEKGTRLHPSRKDGTTLYIGEEERDYIYNVVGLSMGVIEQRLKEGWEEERAMTLGKAYVLKAGQMYYLYKRKGREEYIPLEAVEKAYVELGLSTATIGNRLSKGQTVEQALMTPRKIAYKSRMPHYNDVREQWKKQEKIRSERAISQMREQKQRERKPHLYDGTPQQHTFNEYAQYLADSYKFKCAEVVK